jgi:superfamily II DNA or RNA helicase
VDEAHHYPARTWRLIVENFKNKQIVFLTATPNRNGKPILGPGQMITHQIHKSEVQGRFIVKMKTIVLHCFTLREAAILSCAF